MWWTGEKPSWPEIVGYSIIISIGFGLVFIIFSLHWRLYLILYHSSLFRLLFVRNLFSSDDGTTELTKELFNKAVADCLAHERVTSILEKPIKAFGELIIKIAVTITCFAQRIGQSAWSQRSHPSIPLYRASKQKEGSSYSVLSSRGKGSCPLRLSHKAMDTFRTLSVPPLAPTPQNSDT